MAHVTTSIYRHNDFFLGFLWLKAFLLSWSYLRTVSWPSSWIGHSGCGCTRFNFSVFSFFWLRRKTSYWRSINRIWITVKCVLKASNWEFWFNDECLRLVFCTLQNEYVNRWLKQISAILCGMKCALTFYSARVFFGLLVYLFRCALDLFGPLLLPEERQRKRFGGFFAIVVFVFS